MSLVHRIQPREIARAHSEAGELLSLQWRRVRWDLNEIHLPANKTKALRRRELPMSRALHAALQMRRHDPPGTNTCLTHLFGTPAEPA